MYPLSHLAYFFDEKLCNGTSLISNNLVVCRNLLIYCLERKPTLGYIAHYCCNNSDNGISYGMQQRVRPLGVRDHAQQDIKKFY